MRTNKRSAVNRPNVRSLKVQPKLRLNKFSRKNVPEIKLCGEWLQNLGFNHGARVTVTTMPELLIIRPVE